jgi:hypothetical protein
MTGEKQLAKFFAQYDPAIAKLGKTLRARLPGLFEIVSIYEKQSSLVRHVVINSAADFDRAEIPALIAAALKLAKQRAHAR